MDGTWITVGITYTNVSVTVQDDDGNNVTVVLNGSMNFGYKVVGTSYTYVFYGTVSGTVDGESFDFTIDLKTTMTFDGTTYTFTVTGTAGGETVNETYTGTAP